MILLSGCVLRREALLAVCLNTTRMHVSQSNWAFYSTTAAPATTALLLATIITSQQSLATHFHGLPAPAFSNSIVREATNVSICSLCAGNWLLLLLLLSAVLRCTPAAGLSSSTSSCSVCADDM